jgi:hypothetical protein
MWHYFKSRQMHIYGIFRDDPRFYYFERREIARSKENTNNSKHGATQESLAYSNIQWDGIVLLKKLLLLWHLSLN